MGDKRKTLSYHFITYHGSKHFHTSMKISIVPPQTMPSSLASSAVSWN